MCRNKARQKQTLELRPVDHHVMIMGMKLLFFHILISFSGASSEFLSNYSKRVFQQRSRVNIRLFSTS